MTSAVWAPVIGAAVGGLIGLCSNWIQAHTRRQEIRLEKRLDALEPLQTRIGAITERTCGWTWRTGTGTEMIHSQLFEIEDQAGAVWFDKEARQLVRDWVHAGELVVESRKEGSVRDHQKESRAMRETAEKLLSRIEVLKSL